MFTSLRMRLVVGLIAPAIVVGTFLMAASGKFGRVADVRIPSLDRVTGRDVSPSGPLEIRTLSSEPSDVVPHDQAVMHRYVSEGGAAYLLLTGWASTYCGFAESAPRYAVARRAPGQPPLDPFHATFLRDDSMPGPVESQVEPGDALLATGVLTPPTGRLAVLDSGDFIVFNGAFYEDFLIGRRSAAGDSQWEISGTGIFGNDFFQEFAGKELMVLHPPPWMKSAWVDAELGAALVIGWDDRVAAVDLARGQRRALDDERNTVLRSLALRDSAHLGSVLDWMLRNTWAGAGEAARSIAADELRPLRVRFRAALVLAKLEDPAGRDAILEMCRQPEEPFNRDDVETAWRWLSAALGDEALPLYADRLAGSPETGRDSFRGALDGLACLSGAGTDMLLDWVADRALGREMIWFASGALARLRAGMGVEPRYIAWSVKTEDVAAWWEQMSNGDVAGLRELLAHRKLGWEDDDWIQHVPAVLRWVRRHPQPAFAGPVREFRSSFDGGPRACAAWTELVLREADSALEAIAAVR
jgi:hypothetical protein